MSLCYEEYQINVHCITVPMLCVLRHISISQAIKRVLIKVFLHWTTRFIFGLVNFRHLCFHQYDSDLFRVTPTCVIWIRAHSGDTNYILKASSPSQIIDSSSFGLSLPQVSSGAGNTCNEQNKAPFTLLIVLSCCNDLFERLLKTTSLCLIDTHSCKIQRTECQFKAAFR